MSPAAASPPRTRPLVLCVDDESAVLASVARALRHEPYDVLTTAKPSDALHLLDMMKVDLLLTDQRMAEMSGTELIAVVRRRSPDTQCVVLTGCPDTALVVERIHLRIQRLLTKPWDNQDLRHTIRGLLADRLPAEPAPAKRSAPPPATIECGGLTSTQVMERVEQVLAAAPPQEGRVGIVLEQVPQVRDSLARIFKELTRLVARRKVDVTLYDTSGYASWFLSAMQSPVTVQSQVPSPKETPPD